MVERFQLFEDGRPAIGSGHEKYVKADFRRQDLPYLHLRQGPFRSDRISRIEPLIATDRARLVESRADASRASFSTWSRRRK